MDSKQKVRQQIKYIFKITSSKSKICMQERKKNPSAFLRNIFQILQNPQLNSIIEWAPSGNGFVIKNLAEFESDILPQYFKHKKYSSFVRQLNMYGFHKQRNSMFDNCFLHAQFQRGEELPTDIKRKPEKKKKAGQNESDQGQRESNWLSFSKQLMQFLPRIAENILINAEAPQTNQIALRRHKNSHDHEHALQQPINDFQDQVQEYVSKISLRGLIDEFQENPESLVRHEENPQEKRDQEVGSDEMDQSVKDQCESDVNETYDKRVGFRDKLEHAQNIEPGHLLKENERFKGKGSKQGEFSTLSMSFLGGTMDSLDGLCKVMNRQNQILRKTHPVVRKMVLNVQESKIKYLRAEMESQETGQMSQKEKVGWLQEILDEEKERLEELIDVLQGQIEGLTESVLEQDVPISNTSIRFRLERNS